MLEVLRPGESIPWDYLWQATLFLALGLAASLLISRRPARAHRLLLLAVLAAMAGPPLSRAARLVGWGWLERTAAPTAAPAPRIGPIAESRERTARPESATPPMAAIDAPVAIATPAPEQSRIEPGAVALAAWLALSAAAAARLFVSIARGRRAVGQARPTEDPVLLAASESAAARLGYERPPLLRRSNRVGGPVIWCWGPRPVILLPADEARANPNADWVGVFCHELAHRVRRDHWSSLFAELLVVALPWHPLVWAARRRLGQLGELACDDWALAAGVSAADYAESLLGLAPRQESSLALAAVSSRRGLIGRVRHILDERPVVPAVGRVWGIASAAVVALAVSAVALAQARPPISSQPNDAKADDEHGAPRHAARGRVLGPDGRPIAGAEILWLAHPVRQAVVRSDDPAVRERPPSTLARTQTDADGRYSIAASFRPSECDAAYLLVTARGFGLQTHYFDTAFQQPDDARILDEVVDFRLSPTTVIRGRLLMPSGRPAADARVRLDQFQYHDASRQARSPGRTAADDDLPAFWPRPVRADADGRFALEGVPEGASAFLTVVHPECTMEELLVNTARDGAVNPRLSDYEPRPLGTTFTHTLGPARPVEGRITDRATGRPLAGVLVEMNAVGRHGGRPLRTRTDADGRYRIAGPEGRTYFTTVYPAPDSGYLPGSEQQRGWPAGARVLRMDFALARGPVVRGRVVEAGTGHPIPGAAVHYRPRRDNPANALSSTDVPNPATTDADGRFAVTALPGRGTLLVDARGSYVRTRYNDSRYEKWALYPNGTAAIDVPERGEPAPVEIALRKGVMFVARVVGPDGRAVSPFAAYGPGIGGTPIYRSYAVNYPGDRLIIPGANPDHTTRVVLVAARQGLAAEVEIRPNSSNPTPPEIRLQPTARVRGRLVEHNGRPATGGQVYPVIVLDTTDAEHLKRGQILTQEFYGNLMESSFREEYRKKEKPGADGSFELDALVSGRSFYIVATSGGREAFRHVSPLKPGEVRDLGNLTLEEPRP